MGFRMRNVVEGFVMGGIAAMLAMTFPIESNITKISTVVLFAAPFVIFGAIGIYGGPVSEFLKNFSLWAKQRQVLLYNGSTRLLNTSPVDVAMEQKDLHDRIVEIMETRRKRAAEADRMDLIEGIDFTFEEDRDEKLALAKKVSKFELTHEGGSFEMTEDLVLEDDSAVFEDMFDISKIS